MECRYDRIGIVYGRRRHGDPRIMSQIEQALGDVDSVVDVSAGTRAYSPVGRRVVAVEPSEVIIAQRPAGAAPVVRALAGALPFASGIVRCRAGHLHGASLERPSSASSLASRCVGSPCVVWAMAAREHYDLALRIVVRSSTRTQPLNKQPWSEARTPTSPSAQPSVRGRG
jgi:hypothetical protein